MKKVLVIGLAKSGLAAALYEAERGSHVLLSDNQEKPRESYRELWPHVEAGRVEVIFGPQEENLLEGVDLVVPSPGVPGNIPILKKAKERNIPVLGELELGYRATEKPVYAITGTNGKTTTTALLGHLLNVEPTGNIGLPLISLSGKRPEQDKHVVEVSSYQLESIESFHPKAAALLNITPDHIIRHGSMAGYIAAKARVFENMTEDDVLVVNYNCAESKKAAEAAKAKVLYFYAQGTLPTGAYLENGHMIYTDEAGNRSDYGPFDDLHIKGMHNAENALAAIAMAKVAGLEDRVIYDRLRTFRGVEHRLEYFFEKDGVQYVNDSKGTNPDATVMALRAMKGNVILFLGGYDKGNTYEEVVKEFYDKIKLCIILGATGDLVEKTVREMRPDVPVLRVADYEEGVKAAIEHEAAGDTVLLSPACASWDMFDSFETRGRVFKELVRNLKGGGDAC